MEKGKRKGPVPFKQGQIPGDMNDKETKPCAKEGTKRTFGGRKE